MMVRSGTVKHSDKLVHVQKSHAYIPQTYPKAI